MIIKQKFKFLVKLILVLITLLVISFGVWIQSVSNEISERISGGWFKAPLEFYTNSKTIENGDFISLQQIQNDFLIRGYSASSHGHLNPGEFVVWSTEKCTGLLPIEIENINSCFVFKTKDTKKIHFLIFNNFQQVIKIYNNEPPEEITSIKIEPFLFAQYYGKNPILRNVIKISDIPLFCSQAVTAIEDQKFLIHKGFSPWGFVRAIFRNLISGYYAQGGSTITQQLVKNYFLTSEKTIKRKVKEILMSILLEYKINKDEILENYLNIIYMGQKGNFEVRGISAAANYYINKPVSELNLSECALLAAILNNPGKFNPFSHPENALLRRKKVLTHMFELQMINESQFESANLLTLPSKPFATSISPAPYYVDAAYKELEKLKILPDHEEEGLKVYTSVQLDLQDMAQNSVKNTLSKISEKPLEKSNDLHAALIHIDIFSGSVVALVGGKSFGISQYNRAIDGQRQIGSLFKPLVFLAALESLEKSGYFYTPLSLMSDNPFVHKYDGQSWSPQNYDKKNQSEVPMFYALKNSLNIATAKLGLTIGLDSIIDVARRLGVTSDLKPFPALTLGAFEMNPLEVAKIYNGIARFGSSVDLSLIKEVYSLRGTLLYASKITPAQVIAKENAGQLISMMEQTFKSGTARFTKKMGFTGFASGKTGTTSNYRDAWFVGFNSKDLVVVWIGYDANQSTQLTGASGALPIWIDYFKKLSPPKELDFNWPEGLKTEIINEESYKNWGIIPNEDEKVETQIRVRNQ